MTDQTISVDVPGGSFEIPYTSKFTAKVQHHTPLTKTVDWMTDQGNLELELGPPVYTVTPPPPPPTPPAPPTPTPTPPGGPKPTLPAAVAATLKSATALFDNFAGTELDSTKWASSWFKGGQMNDVPTVAANVIVNNGLRLLRTANGGALINGNPEDAARPGFQFSYGYAEAILNFTKNLGAWSAFWSDGQPVWSIHGEDDIVEVDLGTGLPAANYHSLGAHPTGKDVPDNGQPQSKSYLTGEHAFGELRIPGKTLIYWDGNLIRTITTYDGGAPHFPVLNIGDGPVGAELQASQVAIWLPA